MDKMIHTALNTLSNLYMNKSVKAQNLSNLNVPGFRSDLGTTFDTAYLNQSNTMETRVFALHEGVNIFSHKEGNLNQPVWRQMCLFVAMAFFSLKHLLGRMLFLEEEILLSIVMDNWQMELEIWF